MSARFTPLTPVRGGTAASAPTINDTAVSDLCDLVFASLNRSDQRRKAELYIRGLLSAPGRKSMRNIAALTGDHAAEQSFQHFISCSTWDWRPVREAHARHLEQLVRPVAWVVRPMVIPKAGRHSVGVEPRYIPHLGHLVNSQQAYGVWLAAPDASGPAAWRLLLSGRWLDDKERRRRADIPDGVGPATAAECAGDAVLELSRLPGLRRRPVVLDLGEPGAEEVYARISAAGLPVLARVRGGTPVMADGQLMPGYAGGPVPVRRVAEAARTMRRPVDWFDPVSRTMRTSLVAAVPVTRPARPGTGRRDLPAGPLARRRRTTLLAEWSGDFSGPASYWLTDLDRLSPAALLRMAKLTRRVDRDFAGISDTVGVRDFEGRSFQGWHRHVSLASVAHTARVADLSGLLPTDYAIEYSA